MNLDRKAERELQRLQRGQKALDEGIARKGNGKDHGAIVEEEPIEDPWLTPLDGVAYHGLAGEIVRLIEPETESDPAALLVQILVAFGALVGRNVWYQVEATRHYPNLFTLLVGGTSKGRKGTSWDRVASIFRLVDGWVRVISGLSSGEGLKYQVRDARQRPKKKRKKMRHYLDPDYEDEDDEEQYRGVSDKRLLVIEPEFAAVLRALARHGNTLSGTMRQIWETGDLNVCTRHDPIKATGAHIALIGHVTADELRKDLTQTDMANGLINRFVLCCTRRSKCLPGGGEDLPAKVLYAFAQRIARAAGLASQVGRVTMTEEARGLWDSVYPGLSEGKLGLMGAMTARAEAQAVRWAVVYALLDGEARIDVQHLEAALALCAYGERGVRYVFPDGEVERGNPAYGDQAAERIMRWLRGAPTGLTSNELRDLFNRHLSSERIGQALTALSQAGLVMSVQEPTGGRPRTRWMLNAP